MSKRIVSWPVARLTAAKVLRVLGYLFLGLLTLAIWAAWIVMAVWSAPQPM
jgi:hypothetical protein